LGWSRAGKLRCLTAGAASTFREKLLQNARARDGERGHRFDLIRRLLGDVIERQTVPCCSRRGVGMNHLWHCHGSRRLVDGCSSWSCICRRASRSLSAAAGLLIMVAGCEVAAQEAGTSPTCTGCEGPPHAVPSRPKPHVGPSAPNKASRPKADTGPSGGYDGAWSGVSTGACITTWQWAVQISNGIMSGNHITGHVSRGGAVSGSMVVFGTQYDFTGHMGGGSASGGWTTGKNCSGRWTATRT
jgi:hypothetical protein